MGEQRRCEDARIFHYKLQGTRSQQKSKRKPYRQLSSKGLAALLDLMASMILETGDGLCNIPVMKTLTVDANKRLRIPGAKPKQIFAYESNSDGTVTLTPVKIERKGRFPRGSLLKYITPERDKEQLAILKGCVRGPE